jgi:hypothetical protein
MNKASIGYSAILKRQYPQPFEALQMLKPRVRHRITAKSKNAEILKGLQSLKARISYLQTPTEVKLVQLLKLSQVRHASIGKVVVE